MTKPNKAKKGDKGAEEEETRTMKVSDGAKGADASTSSPAPSVSNDDLMVAINTLSANMDKRFNDISASLSTLKNAVDEVVVRVDGIEQASNAHEQRIEALELLCSKLTTESSQMYAKLDDLESRSRRQNIRIVGIKEKEEQGQPTRFVEMLLPKLFGEEHFQSPIQVDRAHRSLKPATNGRPRAIIARLHHYQTKELVLRLARQNQPLIYMGARVSIYPDLTTDTLKKRQVFNSIREKCRAMKIRCGFRFPARFIVTADGITATFETPESANEFLSDKVANWTSGGQEL